MSDLSVSERIRLEAVRIVIGERGLVNDSTFSDADKIVDYVLNGRRGAGLAAPGRARL